MYILVGSIPHTISSLLLEWHWLGYCLLHCTLFLHIKFMCYEALIAEKEAMGTFAINVGEFVQLG